MSSRGQSKSPASIRKKVLDLPERIKSDHYKVQVLTGLEEAPFLQQFKGQNAVHEGDREKASSIVKNLVYKPASELGRFKYIFSKNLRERHFDNNNISKITIDKGSKVNLGQISNEEISDYFRQQSYIKLIDLLWTRMERSNTPLSIHTSKE